MSDNSEAFKRSPCPVTCALDLIGDKWTLIILRDMFRGKKRYGEFQEAPENIPTNILASRLKTLVESGLIEKVRYQEKPARYEYVLTEKGDDFGPVLQAMIRWSHKHVPGTWNVSEEFMQRTWEFR